MANEYAVLGLGQFGTTVARALVRHDETVLVADKNMNRVERVEREVDAAVQADVTEERTLYDLELDQVTTVIVAIGAHSTEASIMTTALLAQMGTPRIISRAASNLHARVLRQVGAHEVVDPEGQMGRRLAQRLSRPNVLDQFDLGDAIIAEVQVPQSLAGQTLAEADLRNEYGVSVIAFQDTGEADPNPGPDDTLEQDDVLVLLGSRDSIDRIASLV
jgi:trk system potassium uptake protein TrkA